MFDLRDFLAPASVSGRIRRDPSAPLVIAVERHIARRARLLSRVVLVVAAGATTSSAGAMQVHRAMPRSSVLSGVALNPPATPRHRLACTNDTAQHGGVEAMPRSHNRMLSAVEQRSDAPIRIERIPTYGKDWEWVESIAPPYEIENRLLSDFLQWVARETGRHITFLDDKAKRLASRTRLHGSIEGLRPLEALDQVLSATSLRSEVVNGEIRIRSSDAS